MPIFEYQCTQCGNEFEKLILKNSPPPECPSCNSKELEKLVSLPMVRSLETRIRNFRDEEKRREKLRVERANSPDHMHDDD